MTQFKVGDRVTVTEDEFKGIRANGTIIDIVPGDTQPYKIRLDGYTAQYAFESYELEPIKTASLNDLVEWSIDTIQSQGPSGAWAGDGFYAYNTEYPDVESMYIGSAKDMSKLLMKAVRILSESGLSIEDES